MCQKSKKSKGENNNMGEDEQKLKSQFLPTSCLQVSHSQSHNLTQRSTSVEKYMRQFEKLLIECYIQKPKEQTIIRYLGGLDPRYYNLVKLQ